MCTRFFVYVIGVFKDDELILYLIKNKYCMKLTDDFSKARKWNRRCDAVQCLNQNCWFERNTEYKYKILGVECVATINL